MCVCNVEKIDIYRNAVEWIPKIRSVNSSNQQYIWKKCVSWHGSMLKDHAIEKYQRTQ